MEEWVTRRHNLIYRLNEAGVETICLTPSALTPKFVTGLVEEAQYPSDEEWEVGRVLGTRIVDEKMQLKLAFKGPWPVKDLENPLNNKM